MDTETRPEEFGSSQQGLRDAANELAVERGGSATPAEPEEVVVIDESVIRRDVDAAGTDRGLDAKDVADHLRRYHEAKTAERESFQRALEDGEPEESAPQFTPEQADAAYELTAEVERLREVNERAERDAAEARRHLEAHAKTVRTQAEQAAGSVENARHHLLSQLVQAYPELPTLAANPAAVQHLQQTDPARLQEIRTAAYQAEAQFAEVTRIAQAHAAEAQLNQLHHQAETQARQQQQWSEWSEAEDKKFATKHKDLIADDRAYAAVQNAAHEVLAELGFDLDAVRASWSGQGPAPWIRSSQGQEAILRLARQKIASDNIRSHKGRQVPPVPQRPGTPSDRMSANDGAIRDAEIAMSKNPTARNAARLLAARRGK